MPEERKNISRDSSLEIAYRLMTPEDFPLITDIFNASFPESVRHYLKGNVNTKIIADLFSIFIDCEKNAAIVATVNNIVAGYIFCPSRLSRMYRTAFLHGHTAIIFWNWASGSYGIGWRPAIIGFKNQLQIWRESRLKDEYASDARIFSIAVNPKYRGYGIGKGLVRKGLEYHEKMGVKRVRLEVRPNNEVAISLYRTLGFEVVGQTSDTMGPWLIMIKNLK